MAIVLSVTFSFTASDYLFGIINLFLSHDRYLLVFTNSVGAQYIVVVDVGYP